MRLYEKDNEKNFLKRVRAAGLYLNAPESALPQTAIARIVARHFAEENGKVKRAVVFGYDGARADAMAGIIASRDMEVTGINVDSPYSACVRIKDAPDGGLYLAYCGGEYKEATQQHTSTAPGWASVLTGVWHDGHGVNNNGDVKRADAPTVLLELARKGVSGLFTAQWREHFDITYRSEIEECAEKGYPLDFVRREYDRDILDEMKKAVGDGKGIIFGIFEAPDCNGHTSGFDVFNYRYMKGVGDNDRMAYEVIEYIESRPEFPNEEWLYIATSDHGGYAKGHGGQRSCERYVFIASNKPVTI